MKHLYYRLKTLWWFWKLTKDKVDNKKWVIETGYNGYKQAKTFQILTDDHFFVANKSNE